MIYAGGLPFKGQLSGPVLRSIYGGKNEAASFVLGVRWAAGICLFCGSGDAFFVGYLLFVYRPLCGGLSDFNKWNRFCPSPYGHATAAFIKCTADCVFHAEFNRRAYS